MNGTSVVPNTWNLAAILLGRFSAWMGSIVAPIYAVSLVISLTQSGLGRHALVSLSTLPPEVGLALAVLSWLMTASAHRAITASATLGLFLNASALSMAAWMHLA